jgi:hypothetical protein
VTGRDNRGRITETVYCRVDLDALRDQVKKAKK